ncbi:MAG: DNA-directed RNA polymerase subunit beta [Dehalococcoidia bacterium]|nr:DNA-directed RNA polymerase subunit beta [Dehalococcoidia bacterium]
MSFGNRSNGTRILPRKQFGRIPETVEVPNLIEGQLRSFNWLKTEGVQQVLQEVSPIQDFTGSRFELSFHEHEFRAPKVSERDCREREATYEAPLYVTARLLVKETGEIKQQRLFFGEMPMMTNKGTFVINGVERVVISQLQRSPGAYFTAQEDPNTGRRLGYAKLIPYRGAWLEFETSSRNFLAVKVDRKRKASVLTLIRALGLPKEDDIRALFADVDTDQDHQYIKATLEREPLDYERVNSLSEDTLGKLWERWCPSRRYERDAARALAAAQLEFYRRMRPGEPPNLENAEALLRSLFTDPRRYDLGRVGRYKLNRTLGVERPASQRTLGVADLSAVVRELIRTTNEQRNTDDIDHLGNRRVRSVGELIQNQLRVGMLRMERVIRERMSLQEPGEATPAALVNIRPVVAAIREFFGSSQLSQFMEQTNPLADLTHKRRLSALGPGGLSRERAGFEVRDVHHSHYGRICPIETPEGPNIGLLGSLATYARTNDYGFIETPYHRVFRELPGDSTDLVGRTIREEVKDGRGRAVARAGEVITGRMLERLRGVPTVPVRPFVSRSAKDMVYLSADEEDRYVVAPANMAVDEKGQILHDKIEARFGSQVAVQPADAIGLMDVSTMQIVSVSTALIPFLENDDANRALMGSNMQRQAVPLIKPQAPLVGTGMESRVALDSGLVVLSETDGVVTEVGSQELVVRDARGEDHHYPLLKFVRSNQSTCINQKPIANLGDRVTKGQPIADASSTERGELALGQNVLVAFMSWEGYNFEDAIILSESMVREDRFTSVHIERFECEARDTKLGPEEITRDIPNVGEDALRDLDEDGVIRLGAEVGPGDILVGKITPKGETELTAEEKLLRAIFGEKARDVKDTSLRLPHGERGKVIQVKVSTRDNKDDLSAGVNKLVRAWVAQTRKVTVGDKMAGRHGNKGVISRIMPVEDMPFLEDGTPVEIILNPLGVPSRMNLGQVLETHLGYAANALSFRALCPVFQGASTTMIEDNLGRAWFITAAGALDQRDLDNLVVRWEQVREWLAKRGYDMDRLMDDAVEGEARDACLTIWLKEVAGVNPKGKSSKEMLAECLRLYREQHLAPPILGKMVLYDGRTGETFNQPVTTGYIYMMKLIHLVEDKIHARSTGPYSIITQQPLGGKAQFGGQRFGEMEVWALEAYGAAYNLQEMLTVKSDDVTGRKKTYEAMVKGEEVIQPGIPESFQVLVKELQALGLDVTLLPADEGGTAPEDQVPHLALVGQESGGDGVPSAPTGSAAADDGEGS